MSIPRSAIYRQRKDNMVLVPSHRFKKDRTRIGQVVFANGKANFFAGYSECTSCNKNHKILMDFDDARMFAKCFPAATKKQPIGLRIAKALEKRYER